MSIEQGFAIRRNASCLSGSEVDCGPTANGFRGCCPNGLECPQAYNIDCCPRGQNCTMEIVATPKCSNSSWDLFDNSGYFCCEHGLPAYNNSNTNICASPGSSPKGTLLKLIKAGETAVPSSSAASSISSASDTSVSSTSTTSTATSEQSPLSPPSESSTPVGAIAGGVVGGVAGLAIIALVAWFVMRRRRQTKAEYLHPAGQEIEEHGNQEVYTAHQLEDTQRINEAGPGKVTYSHVRELPAQSAPVELSAEHPRST